ncbi:glycine zipper 2TM domain-containing protein [Roseobacter ponti]|nr:glycine zipper 2TM domain-containing protein [Roseobacter ponti]
MKIVTTVSLIAVIGVLQACAPVTPEQQRARNCATGAIGGAIAGGVIGNQVGGGTGQTIATAAGAAAGAAAGQNVAGC